MSMLGYTYAHAYRRVGRACSRAREAIQETSLSKTMLSYVALILSKCERLPERPPDVS